MNASMFSMVLIAEDGKYLLIQENKPGQPWYLPAGRLEVGESFVDAAYRETREEAGVEVFLQGLVKFEAFPLSETAHYQKAVFLGTRLKGSKLKDFEDEHSIKAQWFSYEELFSLNLRSQEVISYIDKYLADGSYPMSVIDTQSLAMRN